MHTRRQVKPYGENEVRESLPEGQRIENAEFRNRRVSSEGEI